MDVKRLAKSGDWDYLFGYMRDYGYIIAWIGSEPAFDADHTRIVCPMAVAGIRNLEPTFEIAGDHTGAIVFGYDEDGAAEYWESLMDSLEIEDEAPSVEAIESSRI